MPRGDGKVRGSCLKKAKRGVIRERQQTDRETGVLQEEMEELRHGC